MVSSDRISESSSHGNRIIPVFYATDPDLAWISIIADLVWAQGPQLGRIQELAKINDPDTEGLRKRCNAVRHMAGKLYNPHNVAANHIVQDAPRYYDARNRDELAQVVCETIFQAEKKIRAVVKSPRSPQVSSFWAVLTDRMEKGVTYQRITDLEEIKEHGLEIVARDMNKYGIDLRILESNLIKHKFYLIDDHYLAVYHLGSVQTDSNFSGVGRITNHPNIIRRFRKRFENYKSQTIPCGFVIKKMREAASKLLLNATHLLDQEERAWVTDIIDFGKFSRFHVQANWSKSRLAEAERRVILGGILYRNVSGHLVPAFPIDEKMLRDAYMAKF